MGNYSSSSLPTGAERTYNKCYSWFSTTHSVWFILFFLRGTSEEIKVTLSHLYFLIDWWYLLVVRRIEKSIQNSSLNKSSNQTTALHYLQKLSDCSYFLVKRQKCKWRRICTMDWLFGNSYPHLYLAIWILMKENGIISISMCSWYTFFKKERFIYCIYSIHKILFILFI